MENSVWKDKLMHLYLVPAIGKAALVGVSSASTCEKSTGF